MGSVSKCYLFQLYRQGYIFHLSRGPSGSPLSFKGAMLWFDFVENRYSFCTYCGFSNVNGENSNRNSIENRTLMSASTAYYIPENSES